MDACAGMVSMDVCTTTVLCKPFIGLRHNIDICITMVLMGLHM